MDLRNTSITFFYSDRIGHRIFRHLVLFVSMNVLFMAVAWFRSDGSSEPGEVIWTVFFNSLFFFGYAYVTAFILFPTLLFRKRFFLFFLAFIVTGILISYLKFIFSDYVFYNEIMAADLPQRMISINWPHLVTNTKDMTFIVAVFLIAKFAKDNHSIRAKLNELKEAQMETEYRVISSQLDPHVLFNNLNNLYSISIGDPDTLLPMVRRLKSLLIYYFTDGRKDRIALSREIDVIRDFVALEKIRYGERLEVQIDTPADPGQYHIVPFILFPFVQNCFEHGLSDDAGKSWLNIAISIEGNRLFFKAKNSKPRTDIFNEAGTGIGNPDRRRKQLELFYKGRYQLIVEDSDTEYKVSLKIKL